VSNPGARDPVRAGTPISLGPAGTWKVSRERQGQQWPPERQGADGLFEMLDSGGEGAMGLLISIVIGGIIGWIATLIMKTDAQIGILGNILIGIVGSALGHLLAGMVGLAAYGWPARTLVSIVGAVILIWLLRLSGILM
jgi:uncharacterized membrane protein YeaQ/YmgE (transglycosylase-associated protein family)